MKKFIKIIQIVKKKTLKQQHLISPLQTTETQGQNKILLENLLPSTLHNKKLFQSPQLHELLLLALLFILVNQNLQQNIMVVFLFCGNY
jgi:hypothetical protein